MRTAVSRRIESGEACEVIRLRPDEHSIYTGAGLRLARFDDDANLVDLFDPALFETVDAALAATTEWINSAAGRAVGNYGLGECPVSNFAPPTASIWPRPPASPAWLA